MKLILALIILYHLLYTRCAFVEYSSVKNINLRNYPLSFNLKYFYKRSSSDLII